MYPEATYPLDDYGRLSWLRLIRSENVGPMLVRDMIAQFGDAVSALSYLEDDVRRRRGHRRIRICPEDLAAEELEVLGSAGGRLVAACEPNYPAPLRVIEDAPPVLSLIGPLDPNSIPSVAVVGSRNASAGGLRIAREIAAELGAAGFLVVSGLARGIDGSAHKGALESGTVAVCAGGLDSVYPPEHGALHQAIGERGLVVSEQPWGTQPQARHFPRRNRLISGLSLGVVVVEAAPRSGSLITARMALEQGRVLMAIPGAAYDPRARGCNALIKDGAHLVETAEDVVSLLSPMVETPVRMPPRSQKAVPPPKAEVLAPPEVAGPLAENVVTTVERLLGPSPVAVDELIRQSGLASRDVSLALIDLELAGRLTRHSGNRVSLSNEKRE